MSYPTDGLPRFKVTDPYGTEGGRVSALVLDRANAHRVAARITGSNLAAVAALAAAKGVRLNVEMDPHYEPLVDEVE